MNLKHAIVFCFAILILITFACAPPSPGATQSPTLTTGSPRADPNISEEGTHFLVASEGNAPAQIKRLQHGWLAFQPASLGTTVSRGDLIRPPANGSVTILCADLAVHILMEEGGSPCQVEEPILSYEDTNIITPMAPGQPVPTIIYPRNTSILDAQPLLRWHDTGASSYTVSIVEAGKIIWQQTGVAGSQLRYPADAPPLQPDIRYILEVTDDDTGMVSSQEPLRGLGFQLLTPEVVAEIERVQSEIRGLPIDRAGQDFVLAVYYAGQGIYGAALDLLNDVANARATPPAHLWRGDLFVATRLYPQAQAAYRDAFSLAEASGNLENQAQAQAKLWRVTQDDAHFDSAMAYYRQLGDEQAIIELQVNSP